MCIRDSTQARQAPEAADLHAIVRQLGLLLQLANTDQRMADRITILALLALAHTVEGDSTQALQCLAAAIQLAAPEGYIRRFVDEGPPMRLLLAALREQVSAMLPEAEHMAYFTRLLEAFPADLPSSSGAVSTLSLIHI